MPVPSTSCQVKVRPKGPCGEYSRLLCPRPQVSGQNNAEARSRRARITLGSSLPTAPKRPIRCVRAASRSLSVVRRTSSISLMKASSTCPPSRSRSATSVWASTSSGFAAAVGAGLVEVDSLGPLEQLGHRETCRRLGVGRVGVDELLVLRHRRVDVTALEGFLGRHVTGIELLLAGLLVHDAVARARLVPSGEPARGELLQHLGDGLTQLLERGELLDQRHRPPLGNQHDQRHGRDLHRLRDLRQRVDVDAAQQEPALELAGQRLDRVGQLHALRRPGRTLEGQQHRRGARSLEHLLEVLLADPDGVRRARLGPAAPSGADESAPWSPDRSTAPGRVKGCWLMAPSCQSAVPLPAGVASPTILTP